MKNLGKYKYKYDLHVHSIPTSGCAHLSPEEVVRSYAEAGFQGIVLTNHIYGGPHEYETKENFVNAYISAYKSAKAEGEKLGLDVILGIEIRFPESTNDFLVYGIDEEDVARAYDYIFTPFEKFHEEFKTDKFLLVQAHPMRPPCEPVFLDKLDGLEVFNLHPNHNPRLGLIAQLARNNPGLYVTCGTDFHHDTHQGMCAFMSRKRIKTSQDLVKAIKSKDYIFDIQGNKVIPYQY